MLDGEKKSKQENRRKTEKEYTEYGQTISFPLMILTKS
jgi:hypothetical protein